MAEGRGKESAASKPKQVAGEARAQVQSEIKQAKPALDNLPKKAVASLLGFLSLPEQKNYAAGSHATRVAVSKEYEKYFREIFPDDYERLRRLSKSINWMEECYRYFSIHLGDIDESTRRLFILVRVGDLNGIRKMMSQIQPEMLLVPDINGMTVISWLNKSKLKVTRKEQANYNQILQELYQRVEQLRLKQDAVQEQVVEEEWADEEPMEQFPSNRDRCGLSSFAWAAYLGQKDVCKKLAQKSSIDRIVIYGFDSDAQALALAVISGNSGMVDILLQDCNISASGIWQDLQMSPCQLAVERNFYGILTLLLAKSGDITSTGFIEDYQPYTPAAKLLRSFGNAIEMHVRSPVEIAAQLGHLSTLRILLKYPKILTTRLHGHHPVYAILDAVLVGRAIEHDLPFPQFKQIVLERRLPMARMILENLEVFLNDYQLRCVSEKENGDKLLASAALLGASKNKDTTIKSVEKLAKDYPAVKKGELGELFEAVKYFFEYEERFERICRNELAKASPEEELADGKKSKPPPRSLSRTPALPALPGLGGIFKPRSDIKLGPKGAGRGGSPEAGFEMVPLSSVSSAGAKPPEQPKSAESSGLGQGHGRK